MAGRECFAGDGDDLIEFPQCCTLPSNEQQDESDDKSKNLIPEI